jgi:hypothetical protein
MNQEIKAAALEVFNLYPKAKVVFVTPDAQAFLQEDKARLHDKDFEMVKRSDVVEAKEPTADKKSAEQLIAEMPSVATIEELDVIAKGEKRKTVLEAIAAQRTVLTQNQA